MANIFQACCQGRCLGGCILPAASIWARSSACGSSDFGEELQFVGRPINDGHFRNEAVAASGKSLNVAWIVGGVSQRTPQLCDSDVDGLIEIAKTLIWPYSATQLFPRNNFAGVLQQYLQQLQRLLLHLDPYTRLAKFSGVESNFVRPELYDGSMPQWLHTAPSSERSLACSPGTCGNVVA